MCFSRVGEWNTKRFQWWKEFEFKDLSIHANPDCTVLSQTTSSRYSTMDKDTCSRDDDNDKRNKLVFIKNPPPLIESLISMKPVNALYNILPITCTNEQRQEREEKAPRGRRNDSSTSPLPPPPAVQVQSTSLRWDSPSQPIIHANLSGIIFNIRIGSALTPIDFKGMPFWEDLDLTTLEVPMPMIWVGNWTLDDIGMMIPDPPEEEGLYPRIGIVNITNVTISVHHQPNADKDSVNMDSLSLAEIPIPDQVFLPLLQLTIGKIFYVNMGSSCIIEYLAHLVPFNFPCDIDAGKDGTDQVLISSIIRESILMILRKQILKEDAIRVSFDKTTELVEGFQQILSEMMSRADEVFESHASKTSDKVNDILSKMEEAWKVALEDDSNPMVRITKDVTTAWDDLIKKMLREVGSADEFKLVFKDLEEEMSSAWEDMKKEVSEEWKMAKEEMSSEMDNLVLEAKQNWNILRSRAYDMVHPFTSGIVDLLGNHHGQDQQTQTS